jgi:hypothetical protein
MLSQELDSGQDVEWTYTYHPDIKPSNFLTPKQYHINSTGLAVFPLSHSCLQLSSDRVVPVSFDYFHDVSSDSGYADSPIPFVLSGCHDSLKDSDLKCKEPVLKFQHSFDSFPCNSMPFSSTSSLGLSSSDYQDIARHEAAKIDAPDIKAPQVTLWSERAPRPAQTSVWKDIKRQDHLFRHMKGHHFIQIGIGFPTINNVLDAAPSVSASPMSFVPELFAVDSEVCRSQYPSSVVIDTDCPKYIVDLTWFWIGIPTGLRARTAHQQGCRTSQLAVSPTLLPNFLSCSITSTAYQPLSHTRPNQQPCTSLCLLAFRPLSRIKVTVRQRP